MLSPCRGKDSRKMRLRRRGALAARATFVFQRLTAGVFPNRGRR